MDRGDVASLYEIEIAFIKLSVKRNIEYFPKDFTFQLTQDERDFIRAEVERVEKSDSLKLQTETAKEENEIPYLPCVFTGEV